MGTGGWGYRDPELTKMTLEWQEAYPRLLFVDDVEIPETIVLRQDSAPVPVKTSNCVNRPPVHRLHGQEQTIRWPATF